MTRGTRRSAVDAALVSVQDCGRAFVANSLLKTLGALTMPVLLMAGRNSPASARAVARLLARPCLALRRSSSKGRATWVQLLTRR